VDEVEHDDEKGVGDRDDGRDDEDSESLTRLLRNLDEMTAVVSDV